jgi:hypothetical protein
MARLDTRVMSQVATNVPVDGERREPEMRSRQPPMSRPGSQSVCCVPGAMFRQETDPVAMPVRYCDVLGPIAMDQRGLA